jgi:uncharacterized protein
LADVIRWLLDTGPLVGYLDRSDPYHKAVVRDLGKFRGQLFTTSAVVTEAMHFVSSARRGPALLADFLIDAQVQVFDFSGTVTLRRAVALMTKYANVPMDFADATLLLLAEAQDIEDILTLDRRGFTVFRTAHGRKLTLVGEI